MARNRRHQKGLHAEVRQSTTCYNGREMKAEVDRILQSETLRHAEALRRLLAYLAEKSASGEADHLKEYTVGVDAFGKPAEYDPRHDSIVRLQAGRLRQKIAEYYRTEGKDDPIIIDLPKGHFRLQCETRSSPTSTGADTAASKLPVVAPRWRRVARRQERRGA